MAMQEIASISRRILSCAIKYIEKHADNSGIFKVVSGGRNITENLYISFSFGF